MEFGINSEERFWRPVLISRFYAHSDEAQGATVLSIESQAKSLSTSGTVNRINGQAHDGRGPEPGADADSWFGAKRLCRAARPSGAEFRQMIAARCEYGPVKSWSRGVRYRASLAGG